MSTDLVSEELETVTSELVDDGYEAADESRMLNMDENDKEGSDGGGKPRDAVKEEEFEMVSFVKR